MKIAMLWAFRDLTTWSTPLGICNELASRGHEVAPFSLYEQMGDNWGYGHSGVVNLVSTCRAGYSPDVVLFMDWGQYINPNLRRALIPEAKWVMEAGDDPQQFNGNRQIAAGFDYVLTPDRTMVPQ